MNDDAQSTVKLLVESTVMNRLHQHNIYSFPMFGEFIVSFEALNKDEEEGKIIGIPCKLDMNIKE
jgi:hypothetical protein